jgi:ABC-type multidrug transport system fused ATPase/permease subunit
VVGNLRFENVNFTYPTRENVQIFNNLSLTVKAGSSLAVVGASGSGKSTLASLLLRYYDPQAGKLYLDDYDVSTIDPTWLRKNIGIVSQEPVLFNASIRENLRYANADATNDELER